MEKFFGQEWKAIGIYDAIRLSTIEIAMDKELLMAALNFWCSATNTMTLPLGPIGTTFLDISDILGTSPSGLPVDAALFGCSSNLDLKVLFDAWAVETLSRDSHEPSKDEVQKLHKNFFNYNTLIVHFAGRGEAGLRKGEHEAFLFYWYNKFICCTKSNKCLVENMPVAEALASGHVLALSSAVLAHLLRCLAEATTEKIDPHQSGPLWVFQLWLQTYFATLRPEILDFSPTEVLGLQLAPRPVPPHRAEEVFKFFFNLEDFSDDEFLVCRRREYPASIKLPSSSWSDDEDATLRQNWGSFVLTRDLPLGCDARRASWEVYHPHFTARQFSFSQGCPVPLITSQSLLGRGRLSGSSERECRDAEKEFQERCSKFCLRPAVPEALSTDTFGDWWEVYTEEFFGESVEDIITKIFGDRPLKIAAPLVKEKNPGGRVLKQAVMIAAAAAKKKSTLSAPVARASPSKRPRQVDEPVREAPRPQKRVKTLAKKGEREIHVISSRTTEATVSDNLPTVPVVQELPVERPIPASRSPRASPALETVEPTTVSIFPDAVETSAAAPVGEPAVPVQHAATIPELVVERQATQYPTRPAIVLDEV